MAYAQRQRKRRATHACPKAASMRGLQGALQALYGPQPPMPEDEQAQAYRALQAVPYQKRQADLALALPEDDA